MIRYIVSFDKAQDHVVKVFTTYRKAELYIKKHYHYRKIDVDIFITSTSYKAIP